MLIGRDLRERLKSQTQNMNLGRDWGDWFSSSVGTRIQVVNGNIRYEVKAGVFKRLSRREQNQDRRQKTGDRRPAYAGLRRGTQKTEAERSETRFSANRRLKTAA